jgi:hypothetical protein
MNENTTQDNTVGAVTGVFSGNDIAWEFMDTDYIDLAYEAAIADLTAQGMTKEEIEEELECWEGGTDQLYGDWLQDDKGLYYPDPTGEFAMIYDSNMNVAQVVHSQSIRYGRWASPCYPGQVDARIDDPETPTEYLDIPYYALPAWAMRDDAS